MHAVICVRIETKHDSVETISMRKKSQPFSKYAIREYVFNKKLIIRNSQRFNR